MVNGADDKIKALTERIGEINGRIEELRQEIKARRGSERSARVSVDGGNEAIGRLKSERKPVSEDLKKYQAEVKIQLNPSCTKWRRNGRLGSKPPSGIPAQRLYWGNYNTMLASYLTARSKAMKEWGELRFHRFDGSGRWTCQIQRGMTRGEAFYLADNRFQIDPVDPTRGPIRPGAERRGLSRTTARIRIGST